MCFAVRAVSLKTLRSTTPLFNYSQPSPRTIRHIFTMSQIEESLTTPQTQIDLGLPGLVRSLPPSLAEGGNHKGQSGKIAVVGGSFEYTGAPFFSAISALRAGADLVHVICSRDAAVPIKCYSPELMVHPLLEEGRFEEIEDLLGRMDAVVVGPGLGRSDETIRMAAKIIQSVKTLAKPMVIDADGLFVVGKNVTLLQNFKSPLILTPNKAELQRMLGQKIVTINSGILSMNTNLNENITILAKGAEDTILRKHSLTKLQNLGGSNRRCGGQGDILSGVLAVFLNWSKNTVDFPIETSCYGACKLVRGTNHLAFLEKGRSTTASDMIEKIHEVFERDFENK